MAAGDFVYTNPEAARQAIAMLQLKAAENENASRERIAREQTAQQRFATASQIADRDRDRAVAREDIASRSGLRTNNAVDAATRERSSVQYQTILAEIDELNPLTKQELEARMAAFPQLSDDLKDNLRSTRDRAYKSAKANAAAGERAAKNYRAELAGKGISGKGMDDAEKQKIYERLAKDPNVIFDRASGSVESAFRPPREDGPVPGSGVRLMPGAVPTIGDIRARITGAPASPPAYEPALPPTASVIGNAAPVLPAPAVAAADITPSVNSFGVPTFAGIARNIPLGASPHGGLEFRSPFPRVSEIAPPAAAPQPSPSFAMPTSSFGAVERMMRQMSPGLPIESDTFNSLPTVQRSPLQPDIDSLLRFVQHPNFARLAPAQQQAVIDEIDMAQRMPRAFDLQAIRPQYVPMDDRYMPLQ